MIEFGRTLRAAREAKGYTIAQIAENTHMAPSTVEDLEKEDFTHIPAPIYGRGFVKLYCEAVGLDPKPMVAEFMEIFSGNHDTGIKERPVALTEPEPSAEPEFPAETEFPAEPEPPVQQPVQEATPAEDPEPEPPPAPAPEPDLFAPATPMPEPVTASEPPPAAPPPFDDLFSTPEQTSEPPRLSRYAAPISQTQANHQPSSFLSPTIWRIAALACAALVVVWLAFLGIRALYRATSTPAEPETSTPTMTAEEATAAKEAKPTAPRTPQTIPALYID